MLLATLFLGSFLSIYHVVSLNAVLPGFITIFHADLSTVQWLMTGFTLATGMAAPVSAYLEERFGMRRLFLLCVVLLTICSILCSMAWSIGSLIVFRTLQGIFCGIMQPLTLSIIYGSMPSDRHTQALGWWTASTILGPALAPTISGWLMQNDWRLIFWITVPFGLMVWQFGRHTLPEGSRTGVKRPDWWSLSAVTGGTMAMLLLFTNLNRWGVVSTLSLLCAAASIVLIGLFVYRSLRQENPLLQLRLFNNRMFTASLSASLILITGLYSGIYFIPLFLQQIQGMSPMHVGLLLLLPALSMTLTTTISTRYYALIGPRKLIVAGTVLLVAATWQFRGLTPDTSHGYVMLWMTVRYIGIGLSMTPAMNAGMSSVEQHLSAHASAFINWIRQAGGALALGMMTAYFTSRTLHYGGTPNIGTSTPAATAAYMQGLSDVFLLVSLITALGVPLAILLRRAKVEVQTQSTSSEVEAGISSGKS